MPQYILLNKLTDQGRKSAKDIPSRIKAAQREAEKLGGKITFYLTFGEYDTVGLLEAPNDEAALDFVANLASLGNVRTSTLKAFTVEEAEKAITNKTTS